MILRVQSLICLVFGVTTLVIYLGLVVWQFQAAWEAAMLLKMAVSGLIAGLLMVELGRAIERFLLKRGLISPVPGRKGLLQWLETIEPLQKTRRFTIPG